MSLFRRHRHRRLIVLCALFGLLFQQLAVAAYLCPRDAQPVALASSFAADAVLASCHSDVQVDQALCHQHCHPTVPAADHVSVLGVPALLPAVVAVAFVEPADLRSSTAVTRALAEHTHPPPLTVQHCTFQI